MAEGSYARHEPTGSLLHRAVSTHLESFVRFAEARSGRPLPRYVVEEFRGYLRCGVLAHGFGRARCAGCGRDMVVAFSCKLRGVCPSCGGRRMSETAADLVDCVLPEVPLRQWVLSVPFDLRLRLAAEPDALTLVARVFFEELRREGLSANRSRRPRADPLRPAALPCLDGPPARLRPGALRSSCLDTRARSASVRTGPGTATRAGSR